jgi:hypothetical protein
MQAVIKPYDWSFSPNYAGTLKNAKRIEETTEGLDLEMLTRPDPIQFYRDLILYEDELDDNGSAILSCRIVSPRSTFDR